MLAGLRRIGLLVAVVLGVTLGISALLGLAAGGDVRQAIATGCYLVGAGLLVGGAAAGVRGPLRGDVRSAGAAAEPGALGPVVRGRRARHATADERHSAVVVSALLLAVGLAVVAVGVVADPTVDLV